MNKSKITMFRGEFAIAVQQLEKEFGVSISLGNVTYTSNEFRTKMTVTSGDKSTEPTRDEFQVGDEVSINHKKVNPNDIFTIVKINKNIKVKGSTGMINVSPGLLIKK
tara:strand:- start:7493 stop:7816 length:324 start_codon:yes stop_codon:yes gene_type:complete